MRRVRLAIFIMGIFLCGFVVADPGISQVNEVHGLHIETTVIAVGNFNQESSVRITSSTGQSLDDMPLLNNGVVYESVYREDTSNVGIGYISYDKDFDLDTSNKVNGEYNIESTRQITFVGVDAGTLYSSEYLSMGGSGTPQSAGRMICPFAEDDASIAAFCNHVEAGSTFNMAVANVMTQANTRFITKSGDTPVELNYNIEVSEYTEGVPSKGSVSAYIKGKVMEGGRDTWYKSSSTPVTIDPDTGEIIEGKPTWSAAYEDPGDLYGTAEFEDRTEIIGDIFTFSKQMHYESAWGG